MGLLLYGEPPQIDFREVYTAIVVDIACQLASRTVFKLSDFR